MKIISKPSPNFDTRAGVKPTMIVLHYTGMKTAGDAIERLTNPDAKVSSHYTVDENGAIYQHVDEKDRAWHAGLSSWQGETNINAVSIGVEIVNPGHEFGYKAFTETQLGAVLELCQDIVARHDIDRVLAHSDVAPDRKQDPGELFPWKDFAENNIGVWPEVSDKDIVKAAGVDVDQALRDIGYEAQTVESMVVAFQRHYVPEVFTQNTQGQICDLTRGRLYALLVIHAVGSD